jgi:hypothetical protein
VQTILRRKKLFQHETFIFQAIQTSLGIKNEAAYQLQDWLFFCLRNSWRQKVRQYHNWYTSHQMELLTWIEIPLHHRKKCRKATLWWKRIPRRRWLGSNIEIHSLFNWNYSLLSWVLLPMANKNRSKVCTEHKMPCSDNSARSFNWIWKLPSTPLIPLVPTYPSPHVNLLQWLTKLAFPYANLTKQE